MDSYHSTEAKEAKIGSGATTPSYKETRQEKESSTCKEQEEVEDKQEARNSAHQPT